MKPIIPILLAVIAIQTQGCFGLGGILLADHTVTIEQPLLSSTKGQISNKYKASLTADAATVKEHWGDPDSVKELAPDRFRWDYNFGLRWNGLGMLVVIVPVPLVLPMGHNYISLLFENERVVSATVKEWRIGAGAYCGFFVMMQDGWTCGGDITPTGNFTQHTLHFGTENLLPGQSFDKSAVESVQSAPPRKSEQK